MTRALALILILLGCLAVPAAAAKKDCQIVSEEVRQSSAYSGYSQSRMCEAGLLPLWRGLPDKTASVMRFTFTSGHSMFFRTVTITEFTDGKARLEVVGGGFVKRDVRSPWQDMRRIRRKLSPDDLAEIRALADQTGAFEHEIGSWDQRPEGSREIFLHCQLLEMERIDAQGYRFSSVNIGCNRPNRLMPLVDAIIERGKIGMVRNNWAGFGNSN